MHTIFEGRTGATIQPAQARLAQCGGYVSLQRRPQIPLALPAERVESTPALRPTQPTRNALHHSIQTGNISLFYLTMTRGCSARLFRRGWNYRAWVPKFRMSHFDLRNILARLVRSGALVATLIHSRNGINVCFSWSNLRVAISRHWHRVLIQFLRRSAHLVPVDVITFQIGIVHRGPDQVNESRLTGPGKYRLKSSGSGRGKDVMSKNLRGGVSSPSISAADLPEFPARSTPYPGTDKFAPIQTSDQETN